MIKISVLASLSIVFIAVGLFESCGQFSLQSISVHEERGAYDLLHSTDFISLQSTGDKIITELRQVSSVNFE
jgi:hypothetical protein